jgi:hypothetical protein
MMLTENQGSYAVIDVEDEPAYTALLMQLVVIDDSIIAAWRHVDLSVEGGHVLERAKDERVER